MPTELRHIIFESAEVTQAINLYYRRLETPLPAGSIQGTVVEPGSGKVRFRITIQPDPIEEKGAEPKHQPARIVTVEGEALAAALLLYCRERSIPMAAKAGKTLQIMGKKICLVATLSLTTSESRSTAPPRI